MVLIVFTVDCSLSLFSDIGWTVLSISCVLFEVSFEVTDCSFLVLLDEAEVILSASITSAKENKLGTVVPVINKIILLETIKLFVVFFIINLTFLN